MPILILGMLLNKFVTACVPMTGGCDIGTRNLDIHFDVMIKLGVEIHLSSDCITAHKTRPIKGIDYKLHYPSVGATQNCLLLLALAEGVSKLHNVAIEPEIIELINVLNQMGSKISIDTRIREITIQGVKKLQGINYEILGDRVEAASWACMACATDGEIILNNINKEIISNFLVYFTNVGGEYELLEKNKIRFFRSKEKGLSPIFIESDVWPGFSTDWVQPFSILLALANGVSTIHETVFENRLSYLLILKQLGLEVEILKDCPDGKDCRFLDKNHQHTAIIKGPTNFKSRGLKLDILDLRAGFAMIIAAAITEGENVITDIEKVERGYGDIFEKLLNLGIDIKRIHM